MRKAPERGTEGDTDVVSHGLRLGSYAPRCPSSRGRRRASWRANFRFRYQRQPMLNFLQKRANRVSIPGRVQDLSVEPFEENRHLLQHPRAHRHSPLSLGFGLGMWRPESTRPSETGTLTST